MLHVILLDLELFLKLLPLVLNGLHDFILDGAEQLVLADH